SAAPESVLAGQSVNKFPCPGFITFAGFGLPPPVVDSVHVSGGVLCPLCQLLGNIQLKCSSISKSSAVGLATIVAISSIFWYPEYLLLVKNPVNFGQFCPLNFIPSMTLVKSIFSKDGNSVVVPSSSCNPSDCNNNNNAVSSFTM
ncbi:28758_t:CDS:2, partial [Racocetra persica]